MATRPMVASQEGACPRDGGRVDVSAVDTVDVTRICDERSVSFLCTSVEEWEGAPSITTDEAIARLKPPYRPELPNRRHIVGSGANPGIVNALVFAAMEEMAKRVDAPADIDALEIASVLITEEDTTREVADEPDLDVFAMTWSPEHCLDELFEPRAFIARDGEVVDLGHPPTGAWYRARCGDRTIDGWAIPHEETKTLSWRFPELEIAFIYRIPLAARRALAAHPTRRRWKTHRLFPPFSASLEGRDRVGVLMCSRRYGELWMGFDTDVSAGEPYGTNATQLQVAAGVVAGWYQLDGSPGIRFVEDLDWREYLRVAQSVLGEAVVVYDPNARYRRLEERRVADEVATYVEEGAIPP